MTDPYLEGLAAGPEALASPSGNGTRRSQPPLPQGTPACRGNRGRHSAPGRWTGVEYVRWFIAPHPLDDPGPSSPDRLRSGRIAERSPRLSATPPRSDCHKCLLSDKRFLDVRPSYGSTPGWGFPVWPPPASPPETPTRCCTKVRNRTNQTTAIATVPGTVCGSPPSRNAG